MRGLCAGGLDGRGVWDDEGRPCPQKNSSPPLSPREDLRPLRFAEPVEYVYQPLEYAWASHAAYLTRFGATRKKVVFVGMNPGLWHDADGGAIWEIAAVRDWMQICEPVGKPGA
ncbi:MAG: hypothetical protein IPK32_06910 [Verrucomicrobiaceae bacterium]|nr:hypothetical protein [Verrucomicrobiaceae bacterium]